MGAARRRRGVRRHGVVAALAHRGRAHARRPPRRRRADRARRTAADARPRVATSSPRRPTSPAACRRRGVLDGGSASRGCTCPSTISSPTRPAGAWTFVPVADRPDAPSIEAMGWGPISGDGEGLARRLPRVAGGALPRRRRRRHRGLGATPPRAPRSTCRSTWRSTSAGRPTCTLSRRTHRGRAARPRLRAAERQACRQLAESDLTGRRRAHRRPRPQRRDAVGFFEDLQPGDYVVHHPHGVARYGGMVSEVDGRNRTRLPVARVQAAATACTCRRTRSTRYAITPVASRRHCTVSAAATSLAPRREVQAAVREIAQELVVLYQTRVTSPRPRVRA